MATTIQNSRPAIQSIETGFAIAGVAEKVDSIGRLAVRYGLVTVLLYIGAMKFTAYEATAISGLVQNNPLMSWLYGFTSVRGLGIAIGVTELSIAALIAVRPFSPKASALGSLLAIGMFLGTLSFLFTTPGVVEASLGFPALSVMPGQFLLKDIALLGIAIWTLGDSLKAAERT